MRSDVVFEDATFRMLAARNLLFALWYDAPTGEQMLAMEDHGRAFERDCSEGVGLCNVAMSGTPSFSEKVRDAAARMTRDESLFRLGRAHVMLIPGFRGSAVRAFLSTMILMGRPRVPTRIFPSFDDAAPWLLGTLKSGTETWSAEDLHAAWRDAASRRGVD